MKQFTDAQLINHIHVMLRQADLDVLPPKYPMTDWLWQRADEARVQKCYAKIKQELDHELEIDLQRKSREKPAPSWPQTPTKQFTPSHPNPAGNDTKKTQTTPDQLPF
jgi:hypothetical protein